MFEREIFDHLFDGVLIVDRKGSLRYANEAVRQLCEIPARAISANEPANSFIELPEECWVLSSASVSAPVSREVGFVTKSGTMGRAQVFTGATKEGLVYVILRDVSAEARVHAKYKVQVDANDLLKLECQRLTKSVAVLRKIVSEIPPYAERIGALAAVAKCLKADLGFNEVYFLQEVDEGLLEPIGVEKRLDGRVQQLMSRAADLLDRLRIGDVARSITYEGEGTIWAIAIRPRLNRAAILLGFSPQIDAHIDLRSFFEMLASQVALQIDNASFYFGMMIDPSTGVYNRIFFDARLAIECGRAGDRRGPLSLLLIEIDELGSLGERSGSAAAESVLVLVAQTIKRRLRGSDFIARSGVYQLAVVLPEVGSQDAGKVADALRIHVGASDFLVDDETVKPRISIGVATYNWTTDRVEDLLDLAQSALQAVKENGGDGISVKLRSAV